MSSTGCQRAKEPGELGRRTCATLLRDLEVHPRVAQRILRHAQVTITLEVYTEVEDEATREALRRLGETLGQ